MPEPERYEFRARTDAPLRIDAPRFLQVFRSRNLSFSRWRKDASRGAGIRLQHVSFHSDELPEEITAWLHIGEDGTVTAFTGKVEIGQNIRTSLAQSVADELRVPFESVRMVTGGYGADAV